MTVSWAAVASTEPAQQPSDAAAALGKVDPIGRTAVLDANALIMGVPMTTLLSDRVVTTAEVLEEVRDKRSRQALAALPYEIATLEPAEESIAAVVRFARATGELHSLSAVDMKLIALTHTLEVAAHGDAHLPTELAPPVTHIKASKSGRRIPGWGETGGGWAFVDAVPDVPDGEEAPPDGCGEASRVSTQVQDLVAADATLPDDDDDDDDTPDDVNVAGSCGGESQNRQWTDQQVSGHEDGSGDGGGDSSPSDGDDGDGWVVAAKSGAAARRRRRTERRRAARAAAGAPTSPAAPADDGASPAGVAGGPSSSGAEAAGPSGEGGKLSEEGGESGAEGASDDEEEEEEEEGDDAREESSIFCVTADFAMQNVILQMGLTLVAPDGMRVSHVRRYVLRCTACTKITREAGRLFCPHCGNAAMEKVEVVIGPGGAEQYGVRKLHVLRGTRYSLPKPRGGKRANNPILREDQLLNTRGAGRGRRAPAAVDPFSPEYGPDSWFRKNGVAPAHAKGAAYALAGWRHNPNERKNVRTNRRT